MHTRLSCKIDYLLRSNHRDRSIASEFFTDDYLSRSPLTVLLRQQVQIISPLRRQRRATVLEFGTWAFVLGITLTVLLIILAVLVLWDVLR